MNSISPPLPTPFCCCEAPGCLSPPAKQLLQQARCECAEFLLMQAKLSIADVAELLGYQDPANFGRAFKNWQGMTPAAWRRGDICTNRCQ